MGYEPDSSAFEKISGKKLALLFGLIFFGAFMLLQTILGFPIRDLFIKETITEEVEVVIKDGSDCIVEATDHPRRISDCPYDEGDIVIVTYNRDNAGIISHRLK
jgi:hypothetical protein